MPAENDECGSPSGATEPLVGDEKRRARAPIRGFLYQFWRTVEAWTDLKPEELLFVEAAEHYDVITADQAVI